MFVIDTNVLVYAAETTCPEHERCRSLIERCRKSHFPWYLTWSIVYEFVRVVSHPKVFKDPWPAKNAWKFIDALLASPSLGILAHTKRHSAIALQTLEEVAALRGNLIHDMHTVVLMREHGIRQIYTRDSDFHHFSFLEVIDPLT